MSSGLGSNRKMSLDTCAHSCNHSCGLLVRILESVLCRSLCVALLKYTASDSQNHPRGPILKGSCRELWVVCKSPVMEFG